MEQTKDPSDMTLDDIFDEYDNDDNQRLHEYVEKYPDYEDQLILYHGISNLAPMIIPQRPPPFDPHYFIKRFVRAVRDAILDPEF